MITARGKDGSTPPKPANDFFILPLGEDLFLCWETVTPVSVALSWWTLHCGLIYRRFTSYLCMPAGFSGYHTSCKIAGSGDLLFGEWRD
ncbi:MAG: hypothetical protein V2B20_13310 [Pseudomonadota bacterium]